MGIGNWGWWEREEKKIMPSIQHEAGEIGEKHR